LGKWGELCARLEDQYGFLVFTVCWCVVNENISVFIRNQLISSTDAILFIVTAQRINENFCVFLRK
jgi:hypothetical protein